MEKKQTLEQFCACRDAMIFDKCLSCRGYNLACEDYLPLRIYIRNLTDDYFKKKRERREVSHEYSR